jgi:hypothetical protein
MRMAVITPSYGPDFELCADLSRSVLRNCPDLVHHHIIVPKADLSVFRQLSGPRTHVRCDSNFLPPSFVRIPYGNYTFNLLTPYPPVRGWIMQQIVKLSAAAASDDDVVLLVDSDTEFVRPFDASTFVRDGIVRFYRKPREIDQRLPRHMTWHHVARSLLGVPHTEPPLTDYISSLLPWNPVIVRQMLARVAAITGRPWTSAIGAQLHFSEFMLYGVFVDEVVGSPANSFSSDDPLCLAHWDTNPLDRASAAEFLARIRPSDVAAMISAKSGTPLAVKRAAFAEYPGY